MPHFDHYKLTTFEVDHITLKFLGKDQDSGMKKANDEYGHMTVTQVKMVSESCN
jgi:hypothetical protein